MFIFYVIHRLSRDKRKHIQELAKRKKKIYLAATAEDKQTHVGYHGDHDATQPSNAKIAPLVDDVQPSTSGISLPISGPVGIGLLRKKE